MDYKALSTGWEIPWMYETDFRSVLLGCPISLWVPVTPTFSSLYPPLAVGQVGSWWPGSAVIFPLTGFNVKANVSTDRYTHTCWGGCGFSTSQSITKKCSILSYIYLFLMCSLCLLSGVFPSLLCFIALYLQLCFSSREQLTQGRVREGGRLLEISLYSVRVHKQISSRPLYTWPSAYTHPYTQLTHQTHWDWETCPKQPW